MLCLLFALLTLEYVYVRGGYVNVILIGGEN
jgi:hypothetical protein